MFNFRVLGLVFVAWLFAQSSAQADIKYQLGNKTVRIVVEGRPGGLTYFAPHENETTSVLAARTVVAKEGGWIIRLAHGGGRNIAFTLNGTKYVFDPNRMFSKSGIKATLSSLSGGRYTAEAHQAVDGLAKLVISEIRKRPVQGRRIVIALHNNTNGSLSALSYASGGQYALSASSVSVNKERDPDDFFLVTKRIIYKSMAEEGYNVVLQRSGAIDDGSLSVYAARVGLAYVNVEAESGHRAEQTRMIDGLVQ